MGRAKKKSKKYKMPESMLERCTQCSIISISGPEDHSDAMPEFRPSLGHGELEAAMGERLSLRDSYPSDERPSSHSPVAITDSLTERLSCKVKKVFKETAKGLQGLRHSLGAIPKRMTGTRTLSQMMGKRKESQNATQKHQKVPIKWNLPMKWGSSSAQASDTIMPEAARESTL